ncbi:unnamed protein product [Pleuronectes platessa]|uniref:Uncharacterized protein n=1 Tax=Pleuronectes platessa TaxID=8262 RepID=A0A9N7TQG4_PLEPL|nr:unnamed protein product [Pleuronectes platessa]
MAGGEVVQYVETRTDSWEGAVSWEFQRGDRQLIRGGNVDLCVGVWFQCHLRIDPSRSSASSSLSV